MVKDNADDDDEDDGDDEDDDDDDDDEDDEYDDCFRVHCHLFPDKTSTTISCNMYGSLSRLTHGAVA